MSLQWKIEANDLMVFADGKWGPCFPNEAADVVRALIAATQEKCALRARRVREHNAKQDRLRHRLCHPFPQSDGAGK